MSDPRSWLLRGRAAAVGLALLLNLDAARAAEPAPAPAAPAPAGFVTVYAPPVNEDYQIYYRELAARHFLESVAAELGHVLVLEAPVTLSIAECGHSTTRWAADVRTVTVCYEFLDAVLVIAGDSAPTRARAEQLWSGAVTFALLAEIGRALIAEFALPTPHGELAAGDEFSAITLASAERNGDTSAAAAVEFFDDALRVPDSGFEYLETHAFDRARLETVACILYGNAPANHAASIERGIIPKGRAGRCAEEVVAAASRWDRDLSKHTRAPVAATEPHP